MKKILIIGLICSLLLSGCNNEKMEKYETAIEEANKILKKEKPILEKK